MFILWQWKQLVQLQIAISLVTTGIIVNSHSSFAQLKPDQTLGLENSVVKPIDELKDGIEKGAIRGTNLFHSFQEFNIGAGRSVYFANPVGIKNILTRVTGSNVSNILGTLGVNGTANLFLINPHGIYFGQNAKLDIQGSFIATTADSIQLGKYGLFSATNPENSNLLTISPNALFFNQLINQKNRDIQIENSEIEVNHGKTLAFIGGNLKIDNANLIAPGGRVELGGILGTGTVEINSENSNLKFIFPQSTPRGDVILSNQSLVNVRAGNRGDIAIHARKLQSQDSIMRAGIAANQGSVNSQAGNIDIHATESVTLDESQILNTVRPRGVGNSGHITITTGSLSLLGGSELNTSTFGQGNSGNIMIQTSGPISLAGVDASGELSSAIVTNVGDTGVGEGGSIDISAKSLTLNDGAEISASTKGKGNAGDITLKIKDSILLDEQMSQNWSSFIHSDVEKGAVGDGGSIFITAESLFLANEALLSAATGGRGNSGDITIDVKTLSLDGLFTAIIVGVGSNPQGVRGIGNGGNIKIIADRVSLSNGALIQLSTSGQGAVGALELTARTLSLTDGSEIQGSTFGSGTGGNITLNVSEAINLSGFGVYGASSGVLSGTREGSQGTGGNITVNTSALQITDGAVISGRTRSSKPGGNITINTNTLKILEGGQILAAAYSSGKAGNIIINAREGIMISGSDRTFDARLAQFGKPTVDPISSVSGIAVNSIGSAEGGKIFLQAGNLQLNHQGFITAETASNQGGDISLNLQNLLLMRNNSRITASAGTNKAGGDGGNININAPLIVAFPDENSDITANAFQGRGGNINITTDEIFGLEFRPQPTSQSDITASSELGVTGNVQITTPNVNTTSGLVELPNTLVDAESLVARNVCDVAAIKENSFVITGKGGLPADAQDLIANAPSLVEWFNRSDVENKSPVVVKQRPKSEDNSHQLSQRGIQQAQGWIVTADGKVILTAEVPTTTLQTSNFIPPSCISR